MSKKIVKLKSLDLTVTYKVGYGGVKMPKKVYEQIVKAQENGDVIEMHKYPEAADWMSSNIKEGDCMNWEAEINDVE